MKTLNLTLPVVLMFVAGCVSKGTFEQKEAEALQLQDSLAQLEESYQQLADRNQELLRDRTELNQKLSDTILEASNLRQDVMRARDDRERAEYLYRMRNAEAGKELTELRSTIDELTESNRQLSRQLEVERETRSVQIAEIKGTYEELVGLLESEIERGEVTISELEGKLTVNMLEQILFDSGKADVKTQGIKLLRQVGKVLLDVPDKQIHVEGHTDNIPISPRLRETYRSNWELSSARALNVVRFLEENVGIPGERLSAIAYGEHQPIASNDDGDGRAKNRRIQIVLSSGE